MAAFEGKYAIENCTTERYLFQSDKPARQDDCHKYPKYVGADANYLGRAIWKFTPVDCTSENTQVYLIQNEATGLYLYQTGSKIDPNQTIGSYGDEAAVGVHGTELPPTKWTIKYTGERHLIVNVETNRMLMLPDEKIKGPRGSEEGWASAPTVLGADHDYYGLAKWFLHKQVC